MLETIKRKDLMDRNPSVRTGSRVIVTSSLSDCCTARGLWGSEIMQDSFYKEALCKACRYRNSNKRGKGPDARHNPWRLSSIWWFANTPEIQDQLYYFQSWNGSICFQFVQPITLHQPALAVLATLQHHLLKQRNTERTNGKEQIEELCRKSKGFWFSTCSNEDPTPGSVALHLTSEPLTKFSHRILAFYDDVRTPKIFAHSHATRSIHITQFFCSKNEFHRPANLVL